MINLNARQKKVLAKFPKFDDVQLARLKSDPAYLRAYVSLCLQEYADNHNMDLLKSSLGIVVRALGATQVSRKVHVSRTGLYRSFTAKGNPSFATVRAVLNMAGVGLAAYPLSR